MRLLSTKLLYLYPDFTDFAADTEQLEKYVRHPNDSDNQMVSLSYISTQD